MVFYGCELLVGQLQAGDDYSQLRPVYSICLLDDILWPEATKVHHTFRLMDAESGRRLDDILEIHTIELERYNLQEKDLATADELDRWLYWFKHAQEYDPAQLRQLFQQPGLREATDSLIRIAEITEDKAMYDAREKAIRDRQWQISSAFREGRLEGEAIGEARGEARGEERGEARGEARGKFELIRTLQGLLHLPVNDEAASNAMSLEQLTTLADSLRDQLRGR